MAKYVSEERLNELWNQCEPGSDYRACINGLIRYECKELNPWIPIDAFLKSKFIGACWICTREKEIIECNFNGVVFSYGRRSIISVIFVTHVQPNHKPEPPKL